MESSLLSVPPGGTRGVGANNDVPLLVPTPAWGVLGAAAADDNPCSDCGTLNNVDGCNDKERVRCMKVSLHVVIYIVMTFRLLPIWSLH